MVRSWWFGEVFPAGMTLRSVVGWESAGVRVPVVAAKKVYSANIYSL
jgi:hypothetical protein